MWLLPATAAPTTRQINVSKGCKDAGPGVHFMSPGLLQLGLMSRLQSVQHVAARLVSDAQQYNHIMPVLHWLLVQCRVFFKMATLVYLSLSGMVPAIWPPTVSWSPMKVVVSCFLPHQGLVLSDEPTASMETCFAAAGPKLLNSLPADLRQADISFQRFKRLLQTFLFCC